MTDSPSDPAAAPDSEPPGSAEAGFLQSKIALICAGTAVVLASVLAFAKLAPGFDHGYDFSTDGFNLVAADPPGHAFSMSGFFGLYLHPIFAALGYDVATYRAVTAVTLFVLGGIFGFSSWRLLDSRLRTQAPALGVIFAGTAAISVLATYGWYLISPGDSWLVLAGMMIALTGVFGALRLENWSTRTVIRTSCLAGIGSFLAFAGRPVVGPLLWIGCAVVIVAVALVERRRRLMLLGWSALWIVACLLAQFLLVAGPSDTVRILKDSARFAVTPPYQDVPILNLVRQSVTQFAQSIPLSITTFAWVSAILCFAPLIALLFPRPRRLGAARAIAVVTLVVVALTSLWRGAFEGGAADATLPGQVVPWLGLLLVMLATYGSVGLVRLSLQPGAEPAEQPAGTGEESPNSTEESGTLDYPEPLLGPKLPLWIAAMLSWCVFLVAITSSYGSGALALPSSVLLVVAIEVVAVAATQSAGARTMAGMIMATGCVVLVAVVSLLTGAAESPYRTAPVAHSTHDTTVSWRNAKVLLSQFAVSDPLGKFVAQAEAAGFAEGTPLADLTPFKPGIGYRLGSLTPPSIMLGWSTRQIRETLVTLDRDTWCGAWVLRPIGFSGAVPRPSDSMSAIGMDFPGGYEQVAVLDSPFRADLWRPKPGDVAKCRQSIGSQ